MVKADYFAEIEAALNHKIDDSALMTTARVESALRAGYRQFALDTECFERTVVRSSGDAQGQLSGRIRLSSGMIRPVRVVYGDGASDGTVLEPTEEAWLDRADPAWRHGTGTPAYWFPINDGIGLAPRPHTTQAAVQITGMCVPVTTLAPGESIDAVVMQYDVAIDEHPAGPPELAEAYQPALWYWAAAFLARAYLADDPLAQAVGAALQQEYQGLVRAYRTRQANEGAYDDATR